MWQLIWNQYMFFEFIFVLSVDIICKIFAKFYGNNMEKCHWQKNIYVLDAALQNPTYVSWYDWLKQQKYREP